MAMFSLYLDVSFLSSQLEQSKYMFDSILLLLIYHIHEFYTQVFNLLFD